MIRFYKLIHLILEYLDRIKERDQKKEEINEFLENKLKLFSQSSNAIKSFNDTFALTMRQYLKDDAADKIAAQVWVVFCWNRNKNTL